MSEYKPGEKVRRTTDSTNGIDKAGDTAELLKQDPNWLVLRDDGSTSWWEEEYFEPLDSPQSQEWCCPDFLDTVITQ